jgi:FAD/FMN-containing dehydrogenase
MATIAPADELREVLSGEVVTPEDIDYDDARKVFNAMVDKRPALILRCREPADAAIAVNYARERSLEVAVRCGGHSVVGFGVCDGGVVIDLSGMKTIRVDPVRRTARAGGGVLWGELDAATQAYGLHTPGGRVTTTGIGGFTTGGGYGWTSSKYGLACDNLLSAQVVLADGSIVTASEHENEDLFWGIRGGGGNFGIVTEFEFRLHPLGPIVLAGLALWPLDRAADVLRAWRDYADAAPNELSTACVIVTAPPEDFVPAHLRGRTALGVAVLYVGEPDEGTRFVQPLKDMKPDLDHIQPMPYTAFQAALDPTAPPGMRSYWRGEYLNELPDDALDSFLDHGRTLTESSPPFSQAVLFRVGQAVNATGDETTAFSHRGATYLFHPIAAWEDAADDERVIAGNRAFAAAMRPFGTGGAYLNFTPEADRVRDAYAPAKYERLVALKDRYDPENLFHLNQNIPPSRR